MESLESKVQLLETYIQNIEFLKKEDFDDEFDLNERKEICKIANTYFFRMTSKKNKKIYAVRVMELPSGSNLSDQEILAIKQARLVRHSNVIKYYDIYNFEENDKNLYIIKMDYCENTLDLMLKQKIEIKKKFTDIQLLWMIKQGAAILDYMKDTLLLSHHNIRPENIQITGVDIWKLTAFDHCIAASEETCKINLQNKDYSVYMAPELKVAKDSGETEITADPVKIDIYALGMTLLRMVGGLDESEVQDLNKDQTEDTQQRMAKLVRSTKINSGGTRKYFANIISAMTQVDPSARINLEQLKVKINNASIRQDIEKKEDPKAKKDMQKNMKPNALQMQLMNSQNMNM